MPGPENGRRSKAHSELYGVDNSLLIEAQRNLGVFQQASAKYFNSKNGIFKMNGTASFDTFQSNIGNDQNLHTVFRSNGLDVGLVTRTIRAFGTIKYSYPNFEPQLSFAFEDNILVQQVAMAIRETTLLIVIGYSFPIDNRKIDQALLEGMSSLSRIVVQDPKAESIGRTIKNYVLAEGRGIQIAAETDVDNFFIPNELG